MVAEAALAASLLYMLSMIYAALGTVGTVVFLCLLGWLIIRFGMRPTAQQKPAFVLGPIGTRAQAVFAQVGAPSMVGRYGHGDAYHSVPVTFTLTEGGRTIETHLTCEARQLPLLQAGAPCELLIDPADPKRLMVASVQNAFGVRVATEIGSSHFPW